MKNTQNSTEVGVALPQPCSAAPSRPGYYWIRHIHPIIGAWTPVLVDTVHGLMGFKKFGWNGWMAIIEADGLFEWGPELSPPNACLSHGDGSATPTPEKS